MRLAWFSPMPPVPSGIAACSAELVAALAIDHQIDVFVDEPVARAGADLGSSVPLRSAHEFLWRHRAAPYDLTVYQLGNSSHHDFLWPYLFRYPGLAVLHDAHLHHARAAALLRTKRADDYRAEFRANHPDLSGDLAELAVAGFDSHLYYAAPMTRLVVQASRLVGVHAASVAADLAGEVPDAGIQHIHLGHGALVSDAEAAAARTSVRARWDIPEDAVLFGVFGGLTPEKRVPQVLEAFASIIPYAPEAHLLLAGAPARHYDVAADVAAHGLEDRVTITGYLESEVMLTECIAASDVGLSLRWPTAREISGPWLRALAAGRATVIMDLEHLADVPALDPRTWRVNLAGIRDSGFGGPGMSESGCGNQIPSPQSPVPSPGFGVPSPITVAVDVMDEAHSLRLAMRRLAGDPALRATLGSAGRAYWRREHSPARMIDDYRAALAAAAARPSPIPPLPPHLLDDGDALLSELLAGVGVASPFRRTGRHMSIAGDAVR